MKRQSFLIIALALLPVFSAHAEDNPLFSLRAGIGTDINLGIAAGAGLGYLTEFSGLPPLEFGIDFYYYHGLDSSEELVGTSLNTYNDTTTLLVYAVIANFLHGYKPGTRGFYFITGIGAGAVSVDWIYQSPQDTSYNDSGSYTGGGLLVNPGIAYSFGGAFEIRLQAPILIFDGPLDTVGFAPMLNLAASLRF